MILVYPVGGLSLREREGVLHSLLILNIINIPSEEVENYPEDEVKHRWKSKQWHKPTPEPVFAIYLKQIWKQGLLIPLYNVLTNHSEHTNEPHRIVKIQPPTITALIILSFITHHSMDLK